VPVRTAGLAPNLMGDSVNEYSGTLSFTQSDFGLACNNAMVRWRRRNRCRYPAGGRWREVCLGTGDLEIPICTRRTILPGGQR